MTGNSVNKEQLYRALVFVTGDDDRVLHHLFNRGEPDNSSKSVCGVRMCVRALYKNNPVCKWFY